MILSRQKMNYFLLTTILISLLSSFQPVNAIQLKQITNIHIESQLAKEKNLPLLILFSIKHCPFCKRIKENFLIPMLISGDYTNRIIIRELNVDTNPEIIGFSQKPESSREFTHYMQVSLFPTMLFLDYNGNQLAEKIVGINTPSLFGGRIDDAINEANRKLE